MVKETQTHNWRQSDDTIVGSRPAVINITPTSEESSAAEAVSGQQTLSTQP